MLRPTMDTDTLNKLLAEKAQRFDANVEALETAYVEHEDFIRDFDAALLELGEHEPLYARFKKLRDQAYEMLLGPAGPERDRPLEIKVG
jgi:hypothetical protein